MALAGGVKVVNCGKNNIYVVIVHDERDKKRGDTIDDVGKFVCEDVPRTENQVISPEWQMPYINLKIQVLKKREEVNDPREGILIECQEFQCPFNTSGAERKK